jgi:alpha-N-arabinofuranosidase
MGLILDEWGVWHDDAHIDDGFSQNGTLRDAIFAASCLNLFHRYAARITMTNIAQVINCLQSLILTSGGRMTLTPTFHVYEMYRAHQGAKSLRVDLTDGPMLSASASRSSNSFLITLVNQDPKQDSEVRIGLHGVRVQDVRATNLTGPDVRSANTTDQADAVTPRPWKVEISGGELRARVPARSVQALTVT